MSSLCSQVFTQEVRTLLAFGLTARCSVGWEPGTLGQDWKAAGQDLIHPPEPGVENGRGQAGLLCGWESLVSQRD